MSKERKLPDTRDGHIRTALLTWFADNCRSLPWRNKPSLFGTWISEIMLQQTTVATVIPYWTRFMADYPDVQALAKADESQILAAWSGLGYYRRARNLHKAARYVVDELGGELPTTRQQWRALPGIGPYASGAIASIGLAEAVPAVDANARRVLSRWFFDDSYLAGQMTALSVENLAQELVPKKNPGMWNEAIMELGAMICRADVAHCQQCPVVDHCRAGLAGVALEIPPGKKVSPATSIALSLIVVHGKDRVLLYPPGIQAQVVVTGSWELGRKDTTGLHQGLWSLPATPWYVENEELNLTLDNSEFVHNWLQSMGVNIDKSLSGIHVTRSPVFSHSITRYRLKVKVWTVQVPEKVISQSMALLPQSSKSQVMVDGEDFLKGGHWAQLSSKLPVSKLVTKALVPLMPGNV